jgi:ribosomal protein S18 acetylase RimI-like enzyme
MTTNITVEEATSALSAQIAPMVGELLAEIMTNIGVQAFNFDLQETTERLRDFLQNRKYCVFVAREGDHLVGFIALYESYALYAEGTFGTIAELYVRSEQRSRGVGKILIDTAKRLGTTKGWTRLEVTTPPLPQYDRTLKFYERYGFSIAGGRKLKAVL